MSVLILQVQRWDAAIVPFSDEMSTSGSCEDRCYMTDGDANIYQPPILNNNTYAGNAEINSDNGPFEGQWQQNPQFYNSNPEHSPSTSSQHCDPYFDSYSHSRYSLSSPQYHNTPSTSQPLKQQPVNKSGIRERCKYCRAYHPSDRCPYITGIFDDNIYHVVDYQAPTSQQSNFQGDQQYQNQQGNCKTSTQQSPQSNAVYMDMMQATHDYQVTNDARLQMLELKLDKLI